MLADRIKQLWVEMEVEHNIKTHEGHELQRQKMVGACKTCFFSSSEHFVVTLHRYPCFWRNIDGLHYSQRYSPCTRSSLKRTYVYLTMSGVSQANFSLITWLTRWLNYGWLHMQSWWNHRDKSPNHDHVNSFCASKRVNVQFSHGQPAYLTPIKVRWE